MIRTIKTLLLSISFLMISYVVYSSDIDKESKDEKFDPKEMILHHVKDAHEFHLWDWNDKAISIPLPIILWTNDGLITFMSSEFYHDDDGQQIVEKHEEIFKYHEKIYQLNEGEKSVTFNDGDYPSNAIKPIDFSVTRNVFMMWVSMIVLLFIFLRTAKKYKNQNNVPKGIAGFTEPLVLFVRDEIARPMIGETKYKKIYAFLANSIFFHLDQQYFWSNSCIEWSQRKRKYCIYFYSSCN